MNDKWALYIAASINKHFETNVVSEDDLQIVLFYEGLARTEDVNAENLVEVRWTGPFWTMKSVKLWKASLILNCAIQTVINDKNNYKIWRVFGKVNKAFATPIAIKTYGEETPTQIGCLQLVTNKQDIVDNYLGQIDPSLKRVQGEVTAHFTIDLEE